jgi:1-acylglycerone phosphate reductase
LQAEVVLVTGAASGIGRSLVEEFQGKGGYKVFATDCRVEALKGLQELGIETLALDVTKEESVASAVQRIIQDYGKIDICVCNAGEVS